MNLRTFLLLLLLLPAAAYCQDIKNPDVRYSEDHSTSITRIQNVKNYTVVTFKTLLPAKGAWVQLNKSMYLQDAKGEARYDYVKSEGIPLRPARFTAEKDSQVVVFKVYFKQVKPGTQEINVIERARSAAEQAGEVKFFNYYNVSLTKTAPAISKNNRVITDTAYTSVTLTPPGSGIIDQQSRPVISDINQNMGPMINQMLGSMIKAQLNIYADPAVIEKLAKITKNYYDALIKEGFSADAALKIITSKQLVTLDGK